jgi:hypothetical protein
MNPMLNMLMNAAGGGAVQQLGRQFGLSEDQTQSALAQLAPAVMAGLQQNTASEGGMSGLLNALTTGNHSRYVENPELLGQQSTTFDGNAILGHIFGSKDVSRSVASHAAAQTGLGTDLMKQMLPIVATMVMGSLSKQRSAAEGGLQSESGGFLSSLFDQNRSGGVADEVAGLLGRFLGNR